MNPLNSEHKSSIISDTESKTNTMPYMSGKETKTTQEQINETPQDTAGNQKNG